ncbi:MAG TPA: IS630 transposase-related protein [Methanosarcina sp.]|nr:IS630 transposase-related protein [Methanosarcina sp.]
MAKAYSSDLRERVIKSYESGVPKKDIINIFMIGMDTLNRWIRKYKETGNTEPCMRTKYRARKFSDEDLREHVLKNPSATLEERAIFFSVKHQSIYTRLKSLGITRKKRLFSTKKEMRKKEVNFPRE